MMPSTARLLTAEANKIHAFVPGEGHTLCGLAVNVDLEEARRFYNDVRREMCQRCVPRAIKIRQVGAGSVGLPLQVIRNL